MTASAMRAGVETNFIASFFAAENLRSPLLHCSRFHVSRALARLLILAPALSIFVVPLPAADGDEIDIVRRLHARITANAADNSGADAYEQTIPGASVSFRMVPVPSGEFLMGSPHAEEGRKNDEGPQRRVKVDAFWIGSHEVTWDEYRIFMLRESSGYRDPDSTAAAVSSPTPPYVEMSFGMGIDGFPAISMTQHAANKYTQWLSAKTGHFYRLPTEAEWEYACRAGTEGPFSFGNQVSQLGKYAWFQKNSEWRYRQIGSRKPNPWGLYDMHGNIWEWTLDRYDFSYPAADGAVENPWARAEALYPRVVRGGSWMDEAEMLRCAARRGSEADWKMQDPQLPKSIWYHTDAPWLGFRLVRPARIPSAQEMYEIWNSVAGEK